MPVTMLKTGAGGRRARVLAPDGAGDAADAAPGHAERRHRPAAQTMGYSVGGKSGTAHKQEGKGYAEHKYRSVVRRHGAHRQAAHRRRRDDRRAQRRQVLRRRRRRARVQRHRAADLRMLGVQPDMNVKPQIVVDAVEESF
jgi:cell division protein FtsI (penicillin-binding protein 3)